MSESRVWPGMRERCSHLPPLRPAREPKFSSATQFFAALPMDMIEFLEGWESLQVRSLWSHDDEARAVQILLAWCEKHRETPAP